MSRAFDLCLSLFAAAFLMAFRLSPDEQREQL